MDSGAPETATSPSPGLDTFLHAVARVGYALPMARPPKQEVRVTANLSYGRPGDRRHLLDIYAPRWASRLPVVMYIHGGGFRVCSKDTHRTFAHSLVKAGCVVVCINYSLGPRVRFPTALVDAERALLWIFDHIADYGGDPNRIGLAGESAGGNLAMALAAAQCFELEEPLSRRLQLAPFPLKAVLLAYPFVDLTAGDALPQGTRVARWFQRAVRASAQAYVGPQVEGFVRDNPLSSPLALLESRDAPVRPLPPVFLSCGGLDPFLTQSRRLAAALQRQGAVCEFLEQPWEFHGSDALWFRQGARTKWEKARAFLQKWLHDGDEECERGRPLPQRRRRMVWDLPR